VEVLDNKKFKIFIKDISVTLSQIFGRRGAQLVWWRDPRERDHLEDLRVDGRIIINGSSKSGMGTWTRLVWLSTGTGGRGLVNVAMNFRVS